MSSSIVDKENSSGQFHSSSSRKFGDSLGGANFTKTSHLSTPQHKLKSNLNLDLKAKSIHKQNEINCPNTEKRRALGDLLNTTKSSNRQSLVFSCATPKSGSVNSKFGTPINKCLKKLTNEFERQSIGSALKADQPIEQENYPPVEKCIPQIDSFNDLFEDGKLSDLFLKKNVTYVPRLPSSSGRIDEDYDSFHNFNIYTDKKWEKDVKMMNKSIKNLQRKENSDYLDVYQDLPELDLPPIIEDFDITFDDE